MKFKDVLTSLTRVKKFVSKLSPQEKALGSKFNNPLLLPQVREQIRRFSL